MTHGNWTGPLSTTHTSRVSRKVRPRPPLVDSSSSLKVGCYADAKAGAEPRGPAVDTSNSYTVATTLNAYVESNVWSFGAGDELIPSWVNSDGTAVAVSVLYSPTDNLFAITGSADLFVQTFGSGSAHPAVRPLFVPLLVRC